ncbi:hypothetical protein [Terrabacter sp. Root181]|uniref:hypothetical protein n=1 Tax=Terrabacter sp. Root181 TaxID=1736484 RepID=UPI0012FB2985|nr:hypothetical protein [Terrabacter sp. Root181]
MTEHDGIARELEEFDARIADLDRQLDRLQARYESAGAEVGSLAQNDVAIIASARVEAERLLSVIRGTSLFGRYSADADEQRRMANRWRAFATAVIGILGITYIYLIAVNRVADLPSGSLMAASIPALALFFYFSLESFNHRRREADRRRIALRMAAVEAYMEQRLGDPSTRAQAMSLMDEFIRQHFIKPELDPNEISYLGPGPKFSLVSIVRRDRQSPGSTASTVGPPAE